METRISPTLPDVTAVSTAPRPTPTTVSVPFADVLAGTVVRGAEGAVNTLPGGPIMTVALRGGIASATSTRSSLGGVGGLASTASGSAATSGVLGPSGAPSGLATPSGAGSSSASPEGPTTSSGSSTLGSALSGAVSGMSGTGTSTDGSGIDSSLAQSQQMNLYYLQVQEQVNEENRSFSTMSNVLKAEHDTMKTAIGNIH